MNIISTMEVLSLKLKEVRKKKGYTQTMLGSMVGVTQQQIAKYEAGISMPPKNIMGKVAQALDLTPYEIWEMFYEEGLEGDGTNENRN